jgi:2-oxo-3-hexenedioate decarboxylase
MTDIMEAAQILDEAARSAQSVVQFGDTLSVKCAYTIQAASIARRLARGERRIGMKMGFTSRAKMVQMGVHDMIWGRLTDAMIEEEGGIVDIHRFVHPRVEPEIAFLIGTELAGIVTPLQAFAALAGIAPAMEIIDSRYENFRFSLADVVADNASSSGLVVGNWQTPQQRFDNLGMVMSFDGSPVQIGSSAAILGDPIRSLVAAARLVAEVGETLSPGDIVLVGAATSAEALRSGLHVRLEVQNLGSVEFSVGQ